MFYRPLLPSNLLRYPVTVTVTATRSPHWFPTQATRGSTYEELTLWQMKGLLFNETWPTNTHTRLTSVDLWVSGWFLMRWLLKTQSCDLLKMLYIYIYKRWSLCCKLCLLLQEIQSAEGLSSRLKGAGGVGGGWQQQGQSSGPPPPPGGEIHLLFPHSCFGVLWL